MSGHLTLTRRKGEKVFIGTDISVTVTSVDQGRCRLTIEAPQHVHIMRAELRDQKEPQCPKN